MDLTLIVAVLVLVIIFIGVVYNNKSTFNKGEVYIPKKVTLPQKQKSILEIVYSLYTETFQKRFLKNSSNTKLPGIDMVYVITMPQRKEYISKQINKLDTECKYFDAVKPDDLSKAYYDVLSTINQKGSYIYEKFTRLPVLLSFIMCFIDAIKNDYQTIIIFEDDISINVDKKTLTESISEFIKSPCDIFYMGYCYLNCNQIVNLNKYRYLIEVNDRNLLCCHALCTKTQFLPKLVEYCFPMKYNSDELFRNFFLQNRINVCVPKVPYFNQNRNTVESLNESYDADDDFKTCKF